MPIFEYRCQECFLKFEELIRSQAQEQSILCPDCSSPNVAKQMSKFGFYSPSADAGASSRAGASSCSSCSSGNCAHCH